jgi:DNA polymerase
MIKREELGQLEQEMERDSLLPLESNLVFGEGDIDARVVFIGEAPGQKEDELKRPFVGRAGQLLNKLLEEVGWRRDEVYITNIVKRRPPDNRDPLPDEIAAYKPYLTRQLAVLKPKVVVTLGRFSMNYFIPEGENNARSGQGVQGCGVVYCAHVPSRCGFARATSS